MGAPSVGGGLAAYGQEPRNQRSETRRAFVHQEMNLYASADRITPTTQSDNRGPPSISSTGSVDFAMGGVPYDSVNTAPHGNGVSNASTGPGGPGGPGGREMCLCPKIRKVPRPRNGEFCDLCSLVACVTLARESVRGTEIREFPEY